VKRTLALAAALVLASCHAEERRPAARPMLRELHASAAHAAPAPASAPVTIAPASASKITFTRMAKHPEPGWNVPRAVQHVPPLGSERLVSFLASESGDETMSLFAFDVATGKADVLLRPADLGSAPAGAARSREEELRRERQRDRNEGITTHLWAKHAKVLVVPHGGDIFVRDFVREPTGAVRRLTSTPEPEIDPKPCDTGERIAFVRRGELFAIDVRTGKETMLSRPVGDPAAADRITHGLSDFVAQEELGEPSGHFWSPRCDRILYLEVDERPVAKIPVFGFRGEPDLMMQRYPRAGAKNPTVRAGIVDLATRRTTWIDWGEARGEKYVGRFTWSEDGKALFLQTLTRDQKRLALVRVDPETGRTRELRAETSPAWMTFSPMRIAKKSGADASPILYTSVADGHRHLLLVNPADGSTGQPLTSGDWDVESIAGLDEASGRVLFTATKEGPLERHLYAQALAGGSPARLTKEHGVHAVKVDEAGATWVDVHSATDRPPRAVVVRGEQPAGDLPVRADPDVAALGLRPIEHVTVKGPGGETLNGALLRPRTVVGRHPAIVMVYGGPESQLVHDAWAPRLLWQHLADRGFVVFQLDNRGTGNRGRAFAQKVHKQLGKLELEDQIAGARWLAAQPFVDGARIGIYGHSYGGFMAALAMLDGGGVFRAGIAGSPVTDWRLYDSAYTERYMETPETNAAGYEASDLSRKAAGLTGRLFLMHAMMDENVHYAHTAKLIDALIAADKRFDLLVLPGERHGLRAPAARVYVPERVAGFFAESL
jgi:dipeptidyl-peptidase-4